MEPCRLVSPSAEAAEAQLRSGLAQPTLALPNRAQVERIGVERSRAAAANADMVVMVIDAQVGL